MKKNILVFPCGSEIGLEIHKSASRSTHFNLIGGSSVDDHGKFVFSQYISGIPLVNDPTFTERINKVIDEYNIAFIFPAHDSVVLRLAQEQASGRLHCPVITSPLETCEIARSKAQTYSILQGIVPTPLTYSVDQVRREDLPVFLKPDVGQGSKGTHLAQELEEIVFYTKRDPSLMILEYLPGSEFTVDCFTDRHGKLLLCEGRIRRRISNGISVDSEAVQDGRFGQLAEKINACLPFRGAWFFQVKERVDGELILMEIATRIAGTMGLIRCRGANLALLSLFDAMDCDVDVFRNDYGLVIDRALQNTYKHTLSYEHVYLDFDDLVIFDGKVDTQVMAFLFQCFNQGVKVHLLTKHKDNLHQTLERYRLGCIFDEVIWIKDTDLKCDYITQSKAIFIDDSFAERRAVHDTLGIPTFDAHMIESLMEKA